jgi:hypothetical protein
LEKHNCFSILTFVTTFGSEPVEQGTVFHSGSV